MSDPAPPPDAGRAAGNARPALTPADLDALLADFRAWLLPLTESAPPPAPEPPEPPVDLHTLVGQFVALRHEVHLQTRAGRAQQEQTAEALRQLGRALDEGRAARPEGPADADEVLRPLLKTLLDVYDALTLAGREVARVPDTITPALSAIERAATPDPSAAPPKAGFWSRRFGRAAVEADRADSSEAVAAVGRVRRVLDGLATGYAMSVGRVERALSQLGLEPLACVGRPFDPERMEVVEVVADSGRPMGEVIDEARRGYSWRGRTFRYAQVRVAKG